jgi:hypothetical protein
LVSAGDQYSVALDLLEWNACCAKSILQGRTLAAIVKINCSITHPKMVYQSDSHKPHEYGTHGNPD